MSLFAVLPTTDNEKMGNLLRSTFNQNDIRELPNNCFVISFQGSPSDFVNKLNLDGNAENESKQFRPCEGVIIPFKTYAGYADSEIWDWLNARRG